MKEYNGIGCCLWHKNGLNKMFLKIVVHYARKGLIIGWDIYGVKP